MSMPPRSRTGSGALLAGLIIALVVAVSIILLAASGATPTSVWNSFFPVHNEGGVTDRSTSVQGLYDIVFYIAVAIFFLVEGLIVWSAFRYRRKATDTELPPQTHGNNLVEVIWTIVPTIIVVFLFALSWQTLNTVEAKVTSDVHVRAVAARFQWSFEYLDGAAPDAKVLFTQSLPVGDDGGLVLPVGAPVTIDLRSEDVIHAFYVPKFLFKRDVVPGKTNTFSFTVEDAGTYRGQCAELCGKEHGFMPIVVEVKSKEDYAKWAGEQKQKATAAADDPNKVWDVKELVAHGQQVFNANCAACHQPNGTGNAAIGAPALVGDKVVMGPRKAQIDVVLNGQNNGKMPAWRQLSDVDIASVISYTRNSWGNQAPENVVQPAEVKGERK